jgi:DNA-binding GntR family transcriptional regulator
MSEKNIGHLFDVLSSLLKLTARQCAENASGEDLLAIDRMAQQSRKCVEQNDIEGYYQSLFDYATVCLGATKNPLLEQMVSELMPVVRRILYAAFAINGADMKMNVGIVLTGNEYVLQRNAGMAEETISDYVRKARELAMEVCCYPVCA